MVIGIAASEIFSTQNSIREKVGKEFVRAIVALDSNNKYVLFSRHEPHDEFKDSERLKNVKVGGWAGFFWDQIALPKALKREKCEVLLNLGITGPLNPKIPFLYILPYYWGNLLWDRLYGFGDYSYDKPSLYQRFVSKRLIFSCDKLILSTHYELDSIVRQAFKDLPVGKMAVVQAGVSNCQSNSVSEEELAQLRKKHNLPDKYILLIGSPNPLCNAQAGILGYKRMAQDFGVKMAIVLVGISKDMVISHVGREWFEENAENFVFIEEISDKEKTFLFRMAAIFFALSFYEKWCLNIMEAISCGIPIVATVESSLSEIAQGAAILVDPKNPVEVSEGGRLVIIDSRCVLSLSKKGVERSMVYQWSNSARKLINLMEAFKSKL